MANDIQMDHVNDFIEDLGKYLQVKPTEISFDAEWLKTGPGKESGESLRTFLDDVSLSLEWCYQCDS